MSVDVSDLYDLADDLAQAVVRLPAAILPVANKAGVNIKADMKADASGHRHLGGLPRYVEYEVTATLSGVEVEVGFLNPSGQGHLENIAAFGSIKNAPVMDITRGLRAEAPAFAKWIADAAVKALS